MTKKEIVKTISEEIGLTQLKTKEIVQKTFDAIVETLVEDHRIELRNFGVFEVKRRAARKARNPRTGEKVFVPEKFVVTFKPGKEMEEKVREMERRAAEQAGFDMRQRLAADGACRRLVGRKSCAANALARLATSGAREPAVLARDCTGRLIGNLRAVFHRLNQRLLSARPNEEAILSPLFTTLIEQRCRRAGPDEKTRGPGSQATEGNRVAHCGHARRGPIGCSRRRRKDA